MNTWGLIWREIRHRKLNALMVTLAGSVAVALGVFYLTTGEASKRETKRNLRDMGQNLRIIAEETDMNQFWDTDYSDVLMPEDWVYSFEDVEGLFYSHLTASLVRRVDWDGQPAILTGISSEVSPPGRKKPSMVFQIAPGELYVGYQLAERFDLGKGDGVTLLDKEFVVAAALSESGTDDDIRVTMTLKDAQEILEVPGQINEIQALDCFCQHPDKDTLTVLREQLATVLPGAKVIKMQKIAMARENQRAMVEGFFAWTVPALIVACGVCIGMLFFLNTRDRRDEIGVLRALGNPSWRIAALFLGKAALLAVVAAGLGFALGTMVSLTIGPDLFKLTVKNLKPDYGLLIGALWMAPAFTIISSFVPAMLAVVEDPASTLTRE